jgi:hypothetical protein
MAGTQLVWERTFQTGAPILSGFFAGRSTRRQVERFVIHPNEISSLRTGDAVVIEKLPTAKARTIRMQPPPARDGGAELG